MKVLHYHHRPDQYGIDTFLMNLLRVQTQDFPDLNVAIAFQTDGPGLSIYQEIGMPVYIMKGKSAKDPLLFLQLLRIYRNYDVINLHNYSPWALLAAIVTRKKIVFTFHGAFGLKRGEMYTALRWYYKYIVNRCCYAITFASTASLERYCQTTMTTPDEKLVKLFPYGLQIENIVASKSKLTVRDELGCRNCFLIGIVARMDPVKKIERAIDSLGKLPGRDNLRLLLIGAGDRNYETYLKQRTADLHLESNVTFLGFRKDVLDLINSVDLFVLSSKKESFGLALLEAMALGIPCAVFFDGGGLVDIIGHSGFVVNTPQELADIIQNLRNDESLKKQTSEKAKARAAQFDIRYTAQNLKRIYATGMR